jgi:hypothetical protein
MLPGASPNAVPFPILVTLGENPNILDPVDRGDDDLLRFQRMVPLSKNNDAASGSNMRAVRVHV